MTICYFNGTYGPLNHPRVSPEDRGFQFGDGVYIVMAVVGGRIVDLNAHMEHLESYLKGAHLPWPFPKTVIPFLCREVLRRNALTNASLYLQVTRGVAPRCHTYDPKMKPSLFIGAKPVTPPDFQGDPKCIAVITHPDIRWKRCYIKSTSLLPTVLLRQKALESQAQEAWLLDDQGYITEGASSNAFLITHQGQLITRPQDGSLVPGVTRTRILSLCHTLGIPMTEKKFTKDDVFVAKEAFLSGATTMLSAVTSVDGCTIGDGRCGPITRRLFQAYGAFCMDKVPRLVSDNRQGVRTVTRPFKEKKYA